MQVLYALDTGLVLARYPIPFLDPITHEPVTIVPAEGQALIPVPPEIPIPEAILRVLLSEDQKDPDFVLDQPAIDQQWRSVKDRRAQLLRDSDWICSVTDYTPPNKPDWILYRQALRDLTQQPNPFQIQWPTVLPPAPLITPEMPSV